MAITRKKAVAMVKKLPVMTWDTTKSLVMFLWNVMKNPHLLKEKLAEAQYHLKEVPKPTPRIKLVAVFTYFPYSNTGQW